MGKEILSPKFQGVLTNGNNALDLYKYRETALPKKAEAFRHEFYNFASDRQIEDDVVSYLGEYRLEVSEFDYELDFINGELVDPGSGESMVKKGKKAIEERKRQRLGVSRETAETEGIVKLKNSLLENPKRTVVWFSPPGNKEEGYGDYGFGYVGKLEKNKLKMTAIRLENPKLTDFNSAAQALWGKEYQSAEDFLSSPQVIDLDIDKVKEFILGNFEIKDEENKNVFDKIRRDLKGVLADFVTITREGTEQQRHKALHVVEHLTLELKDKYKKQIDSDDIIYLQNHQTPSLSEAMNMQKYSAPLAIVRGSCGISANKESNDIFRNLNFASNTASNSREYSFDQPGPCRICGEDVSCGPCKICESCNDRIDMQEQIASSA